MHLAPITRAAPPPATATLRRLVGLPVLAAAALVVIPWILALSVVAGLVLLGRFGLEATHYAGAVALGR